MEKPSNMGGGGTPKNPFAPSSGNQSSSESKDSGNPFARENNGNNMGGQSSSLGGTYNNQQNPFERSAHSNMGGSSSSPGKDASNPFKHSASKGAQVETTEGGLEVMSSVASPDSYEKTLQELRTPTAQGGAPSASESVANYQTNYEKEDAVRKAEQDKQKTISDDRIKQEAAQKARDEQKAVSDYIVRAREIQTQIAYWQGQAGQGRFADDVVNSTLQQLNFELNGIPSTYR